MQAEAAQYSHARHPSTPWSPNHDTQMYPRDSFKSPPPAHDVPPPLSRRESWQNPQFPNSPPLSTVDGPRTGPRYSHSPMNASSSLNMFLQDPAQEHSSPRANGFPKAPEPVGVNNNTPAHGPPPGNPNGNANPKAKFVCTKKPGCNKTFAFKSLQEKHEATHIKPFVCEYCKNVVKSFASKTDLQRHTNNVHFSSPSSAFSYRCKYDQCANRQRIILRLDNFKTHLKRKHKKPEEPDSDDFYSRAEKECRIYREATQAPVEIPHEQHRQEISKAHAFTCEVPSCSMNNVGFGTEDELRRHRREEHELGDSPQPELNETPTTANPPTLNRGSIPGKIQLPQPGQTGENWQLGDYYASPISGGSERPPGSAAQTHSRQQEVAVILTEMRGPNRQDSLQGANSDDESHGPARKSTLPTPGGKRQLDDGLDPKNPKRSKTTPLDGKGTTRSRKIECEICKASFHQYRDLKKHRIRHDRPFQCTYDGCDGTFGSKNDWVRHEKSQHFKLESWKCPLNNKDNPEAKQYFGVRCRTRFFRREGLREHIRRWHQSHLTALYQLVDENPTPGGELNAPPIDTSNPDNNEAMLKTIVDKSFETSNPSDTFWCGFCRRTQNVGKGTGTMDRYEHIGAHFDSFIKGGEKKQWHRMEAPLLGMNQGSAEVYLTEPVTVDKGPFDPLAS